MPDNMRRVVVFLCAAGLVAAQEPAQPEKPFSVTVRNVLAPVTVEDAHHDFVPGLTPYDFRLYDNGKLQNITQDMATHPLSVVVVIQANADVEKILPYIKRLSSVFESLVIGEDGEMAVIGFDHRIKVLTDFTSDSPKIDGAFQALSVGGYTAALNDATMRAVGMLKSRPINRRRVVIQIAENRDKGSEIRSVREILTEAEFANVVFYSIDISKLMSALTTQAQPNRPDTIPPGGEHLPMEAGALGRIPISIFELNATPGKTNKILSFFAKNVYVTFHDSSKYFKKIQCKFVDYPIRFNSKNIIEQKEALKQIDFDETKKTILILGGSQGSSFINQVVKKIFSENNFQKIQIIHQAGKDEYLQMREFFKKNNIKSVVFDYFHDLSIYYCAADLVICRAGAGTLFETKFFNKKAVIIPLETNQIIINYIMHWQLKS